MSQNTDNQYETERLKQFTLDSLAHLMEKHGISVEDVAKHTGTSPNSIRAYFQGRTAITLASVAQTALACGYRAVVNFEPISEKSKDLQQ